MLSDASAQAVPLGQVAERVGVTPGTVTSMMRHLAVEGLVDYVPRRGVTLTRSGRKTAMRVLRRHRLIECFLVRVMHVDWAYVHQEAEILEHAVSDRLLERMDEMLGYPARDPHGDPIPSLTGHIPKQDLTPLSDCSAGDYRVVQVLSDEPAFLAWLEKQGLRPGSRVRVGSKDDFAQTITIATDASGAPSAIGASAASRLMVAGYSPAENDT
jgi:DtxR family Mn-dependent transcriptional regulator